MFIRCVTAVILLLLTGCYTAANRCSVATAEVNLYERWAADPAITLNTIERRDWLVAATEEALWCEHPLSRED